MSDDAVTVLTTSLRATAGALESCAHQLAHGLAGQPGLIVDAPQWAVAAALTRLESAVHDQLAATGARVAVTSDALRRAAEGYDTVDERAAQRLTRVPR